MMPELAADDRAPNESSTFGSPADVVAQNETYFVRPFVGYQQVYPLNLKL